MREALEACGEFLCRIGALEEANAIAEILRKTGAELPESSPFRWRALLAAIRQELVADPMDVVFVFERLLQLDATLPSAPASRLERFAVAFEGLDAELFKLESDELCHAEGVYETCLLIRDKIEESDTESGLKKFLATFKMIFEQDEPKDCWEDFYELYRLNDASFRCDMKRALWVIESVTLGPTQLELAFPPKAAEGPKKVVPRPPLEKRLGGTRRVWRDLSQITSIAGADIGHVANDQPQPQQQQQDQEDDQAQEQAQEQEQETQEPEALIQKSDLRHRDHPVQQKLPGLLAKKAVAWSLMPRAERVAVVNPARQGGRRKGVRWSEEEEAALIEGYRLYESYSNVWVLIKSKFPEVLQHRSNVDLKDKYRNLIRYGKIPQANNAGATDNDATDNNAGTDAQAEEN
ncbi:Myb-like domain [Phytophthora cactorum]|nr:Myb-like domain [Phytophthora cactorum]